MSWFLRLAEALRSSLVTIGLIARGGSSVSIAKVRQSSGFSFAVDSVGSRFVAGSSCAATWSSS